jgi:NTP pyrophosphatase (non-canonical NTP hydrolase)
MYCVGKLNGEAGEIAEEVFKALRDDEGLITTPRQDKLFKELGDVMWYVSQICNELGFKLSEVMDFNLAKLADRQERDVLGGSGDDR